LNTPAMLLSCEHRTSVLEVRDKVSKTKKQNDVCAYLKLSAFKQTTGRHEIRGSAIEIWKT
jgi:hypothetical protein